MKTKNLFRKILPAALLLALMVIVAVSCKKKDTEEPVVPPQPTTPVIPDAFDNKPLKILSQFEIEHGKSFPGHLLNHLGHGLLSTERRGTLGSELPEIPPEFEKIADVLSEIQKGNESQAEFNDIMNGLNAITQQIIALQSQITTLGKDLSLDVSELANLMSSTAINQYLTDIQGVMEVNNHNGLPFYAQQAALIKANQSTMTWHKLDSLGNSFANNIYNVNGHDVCGDVRQLHSLICPPAGAGSGNALKSYANVIIQKCNGRAALSETDVMNSYLLLESYFLQIINYQYQAATVWSNACNRIDTTGYQANLWYSGTFTTIIQDEMAQFITTVDYLSVNLVDYRTTGNMRADLSWALVGLAPDNYYSSMLARSRFLYCLLNSALGLQASVLNGVIITPAMYNNEMNNIAVPNLEITVGGYHIDGVTDQFGGWEITSQFPYTWWTIGDPATSHPDNKWNLYNYASDKNSLTYPSTALPISVVDNGNQDYPWTHLSPITGSVTCLYYNPEMPSQTSATSTATCWMQFGFFSARWNWGYPFITMTNPYSHRPPVFDFFREIKYITYPRNPPPIMGITGAFEQGWYPFVQKPTNGFSCQYHNMAEMSFNGQTVATTEYFLLGDLLYVNINTGSDPLPDINGKVALFGFTNISTAGTDYTGGTMISRMGTGLQEYSFGNQGPPPAYSSNSNLVTGTLTGISSSHPNWNAVSLNANSNYQPSVEYFYSYDSRNGGVTNLSLSSQAFCQVVYQGTYNIFNK